MSEPQKPEWAKDEFVVVTSGEAQEALEALEDEPETFFVWLKVLSQLRPTEEPRFCVELDREEMALADTLVSLKLLTRDSEDPDRYWVDRKMAYADYAANVLHKDLN